MRIGSTNRSGPVSVSRGTRGAGGGGRFTLDGAGTSQGTQLAGPARPVASVDSLLSIQEVPDHGERARRAIRRGTEMLDVLDEVKIGLLAGVQTEEKLVRLLKVVESRSGEVADPGLADILDGIELRARVELAKRGRLAA